jgi:cyclic pyranopterin phosphate synthase
VAEHAGFDSIKINMVVRKGSNEQEILPMAKYFKQTNHTLRLIEYMDVGSCNNWSKNEVLSSKQIVALISENLTELYPLNPRYAGEVSQRWGYKDSPSEIGVISSVTQPFCNTCSRIRLSTDGKLYTCLFANEGFDIKTLLRTDTSEQTKIDQLDTYIQKVWQNRTDRYSELRAEHPIKTGKRIEMSYIGG